VPIMAKNNYLSQYSLEQLSQGEIKKESFGMCFTSGTTGIPFAMPIWKKNFPSAIKGFFTYLQFLWEIYSKSKSILFINGLALGSWLAGFFVTLGVADEVKKHNFTLVTPGSDPKMMIEILKRIGKNYDEIIIICYASVLKAFFEEGEKENINWKEFNIKTLTGGEPFFKTLKEDFLNKLDSQRKESWRVIEIFATSDASILGYETPLTILIKEILNKNKQISLEIFNRKMIRTLFQYNSLSVFLEDQKEKILVTKPGIIPLIRYQIGDLGKVISFEKMKEVLEKEGYNIDDLLKKADWQKGYFKWPFFTYLGRADNMLKIYSGAKVYAENLLGILEKPEAKEIRSFKLTTENDENLNTRLIVYLELKPGLAPSTQELDRLTKKYQKIIHEELFKNNLEYQDAYRLNSEVVLPIVRIFTYGKGIFERDKSKPKTKLLI